MLSADAPSGEDGSELKPTPDDQVILGRDDSRIEDDLVQGDSSPRELPDPAMLMHVDRVRTDPEADGAYTDVSGAQTIVWQVVEERLTV